MENNEFIISLMASLDEAKSRKRINADIKQLEKAINTLRLTGILAKGDTKKGINQCIKDLSSKLNHLKLKGKIDEKNLKREINKSLHNMTFDDIEAIKVDGNKTRLKIKKVIADAKAYAEKNPVSVNIGMKKEKLDNDLTTFLNKNTKIRESSILLKEGEKVRELIGSVDDKDTLKAATDAFQLFKSEVSATGYASKSTADKIKGMLSQVVKIGSFFGVASLAVNSFRKSLGTLKGNDTILTEISKTSEMTRKQLEGLGDEAFKVASKYGQLSSGYLLGVQEMARSGYESLSKELGELSLLTQSAEDMTADDANNYLLATDAAYKYEGSVEKLTAALDGANYISNRNSASLTDLADATRVSASFAANAGVEIDELTAAEAVMIATTKRSGSEMGRAFRSIILNLQQVSGEFDGEIIDEEQLKKVEARCHSLGVELEYMKNGVATLRNPMEVLKDLAKVYNSLPDDSADKQGLISDLGGKYHANALSSLLGRWDMYEKMLSEFSQGTGSALEEAEKTANSWEGRLNSLQNSLDSFFNSLINKEAVMGGITFFDRMVQGAESLMDSVGEITVMVTGLHTAMTAMNKDYGITQIWNKDKGKLDVQGNIFGIDITNIKNLKKHFAEAEGAISGWNAELISGNADINKFNESVVQNNAQLKSYLATCSKDAPASLAGYQSYLKAAGVATDGLRLKTVLLNAAISFGIGAAVQVAVKAFSGLYELSQVSSTVAEKAKDLGSSFKSTTADIEGYKSKIEELYTTINDSSSSISDVTDARKSLMAIQDELIGKYGTEKEVIDTITQAVNGQADAFDRLTEKQWAETKNGFNDAGFWEGIGNWIDGYGSNIDRMVSEMEDVRNILSFSYSDFSSGEFDSLSKRMEKLGWEYQQTLGGFVKNGSLKDIYSDILEIQNMAKDMEVPDSFLKDLTKDANKAKETVEDYSEMWDNYVLRDVILENRELSQSLDEVNEAYSEYKESFESGDKGAQDDAIGGFAKALNGVLDNPDIAESVKGYFRDMYPALTNEVGKWEFRFKVLPDLDIHALKGRTQADVLEMLQTDGNQYGESTFDSLLRMADDYGIIVGSDTEKVQQLLDLLVEWEVLQGDILEEVAAGSSTFDISSYEDQIDSIQSAITTLRSALDSFNSGTMEEPAVLDLMQQFPELLPYIDLAADGFGNLSEGLSALIAQQPDNLIIELEKLKDSLNTDAEREQVDLLIDSLQRLSSYGDSGIEAYAATIGSTWNDTANVIEGVTSQFENLAKVQEAVADGLTMSADAAAELAKMYPQILDHAQVTADGQITLNEEVVESILDGDKSILDAQIAKLEADKAELEARKETAIAELEIANQVGTAKGQISEEEARHQIEVLNAELEAEIEKNRQAVESYALGTQDKAQNASDFNVYAATVATDIASNMSKAAASMAESMRVNSANAQRSLGGIMQKAADVAKAIAEMATGAVTGAIDKVYEGVGGIDSGGISVSTSAGGFTPTVSDYLKGDISLGDFKAGLESDISAYIDAISNIDAQIAILRNLQESLGSGINGGIGGHGYADRIKDLEEEKDRIKDAMKDKAESGSGSMEEAKEEFSDTVDFFERRAEALDEVLSLLKASLDNVSGSFAKNKLVDEALGVTEEKFNNYTDALAMYTQKANEALAKLPADIAAKVKEGAVELTDFIGDGNKDVVEAIKEYESWADKVSDCKQELAGLQKEIRQLELEKFNNIMDEFNDQFDLRSDSKNLISKQIDLLKEAGELVGGSFFKAQIDQSQKQLDLLESEKARLVAQMEAALASGRVQKGTDEWLEMIGAISDVEGKILDCKKSIEEFDNAILEIHTEVFNRIQDRFSDLSSEISNIIDLFDGMEVSDDKGAWSKEGIAQLGLLAQKYELAKHQVQQYNDEIAELKAQYAAGKYSATEYMDRLSELSKGQWDAVSATEAAKDAILELNEARVENAVKGIEKEIDSYKSLTEQQLENLRAEKDLHDYQKSISEKTKSVADLEKQIEAMRNDTSLASVAKRKRLEEQLVEAKKVLEEEQYQHSIEAQQDALNKQFEEYEKSRNDEIESLRASLDDKEAVIAESFQTVKDNADIVGQEIAAIAVEHGIAISDALVSSWKSGETAIASYGEALTQGTSAFIASIIGVEDEMWNLQSKADATADALAWMFSTKADRLVGELSASYYAEANLANMTNTLQGCLISALERGYNVSSIVNSLNSITAAANAAANAVSRVNGGGGSSTASSPSPSPSAPASPPKQSAKPTTQPPKADDDKKQKKPSGGGASSKPSYARPKDFYYADGTRDSHGGIIIKDEEGYEIELSKLSSGRYALANEGSQIFTKGQTDNLFEWSKLSPQEMRQMMSVDSLWGGAVAPEPMIENRTSSNNPVQIGNLINVQGSVDSASLEEMRGIANKIAHNEVASFAECLSEGIMYGRSTKASRWNHKYSV